ncbi:hypothetical protein PC112_g5353 [Phytophthora cactorum]|nr:hypothetical protein PC112_g5353 [Phytophthora cactorum]
MAEAPPGQKRKRDEPPGTRKRRRVRSSVERASAETARSLGGVAAFKDVWGALVKAGWTSKRPSSKSDGVSGSVDQAADVEPNEKGDRDEEAARVSGAAGIVGHGGGAGVDVGAGYDDAAGHVAVAGRGAQGGSGGRTTRRVASTNSAEGVEDDGCEVGGDDSMSISFNYGVSGAASQAVVAGRGSRGRGAGGRRGGRTARRVARASSPTGVGVSGAAGQEGVAGPGARGRGVRGGRGGRTARRAASTASAEGDACV